MKLLNTFLLVIVLSSLALAQHEKPVKSTPKKTGTTKSNSKKASFSPTLSRSVVSSSVVSTSINSTPVISTTTVSTTAISKITTTRQVADAGAAKTLTSTTRVSPSTTKPTIVTPHPAVTAPERRTLVIDDPLDLKNPTGTPSANTIENPEPTTVSASNQTAAPVRRRLIPAPLDAGSSNGTIDACRVLANDALVVYNLCADGPCGGTNASALQIRIPNGDKRKWQYLKASDNVRMNIISSNPGSCTVTLNTVALENEFIIQQSPITPITLSPTASSTTTAAESTPAPPNPDPKLTDSEKALIDAVTSNLQTLDSYTAALQEERKLLSALPCVSNEVIVSKRNARLAGETISRQQVQANLDSLLSQLGPTQVALRKSAEAGLSALQAELDQWAIFLAGTTVRGQVVQARDNDFIRFVINQRCSTEPEKNLTTINIPVYGNFRLNVSTGFLISGLVDHKFLAIDRGIIEANLPISTTVSGNGSTTVVTESSIINAPVSTASTSTKVPVQDITSRANIGIGALLHAYVTSPWIKGKLTPAVSLGASLNAAGRYTLLIGGSLMVSGKARIVFTGGYALGPVARLQKPFTTSPRMETKTVDNLQTNSTITTAYEFSGAEFPTTPKTKGSWFFAITYNLSSKRNPISPNP
jgi:hypothetical protein